MSGLWEWELSIISVLSEETFWMTDLFTWDGLWGKAQKYYSHIELVVIDETIRNFYHLHNYDLKV